MLLHIFRMCFKADSQTICNVKALNKLTRQLKSQPVKLQFWPLAEQFRTIVFPDASHRNNDDGFSQEHGTIPGRCARTFFEGWDVISMSRDGTIRKIALSTTVAELYHVIFGKMFDEIISEGRHHNLC